MVSQDQGDSKEWGTEASNESKNIVDISEFN